MAYKPGSSIPDYEGVLDTLESVLEDALDTIDENRACGVRSDISCLGVLDDLNQYLERLKVDMGI